MFMKSGLPWWEIVLKITGVSLWCSELGIRCCQWSSSVDAVAGGWPPAWELPRAKGVTKEKTKPPPSLSLLPCGVRVQALPAWRASLTMRLLPAAQFLSGGQDGTKWGSYSRPPGRLSCCWCQADCWVGSRGLWDSKSSFSMGMWAPGWKGAAPGKWAGGDWDTDWEFFKGFRELVIHRFVFAFWKGCLTPLLKVSCAAHNGLCMWMALHAL